MRVNRVHTVAGLVCAVAMIATAAAAGEMEERIERSRAAVKEFGGNLQAALKSAFAEGGPVNAIRVCNIHAPEIAAEISEKRGWEVGRTSLKVRNPTNAPDAWESAVLEDFEARKAAGRDPAKLEHAEIVTGPEGERVFRYMKAIPTGGICITCHGESIAPEVIAVIDALYPEDEARGFAVGDIRGAFTIREPL